MAIVSGNGGSLLFQTMAQYVAGGGADTDEPLDPIHFTNTDDVEVGIAKWSANFDPRLQEVTRSFNTNGTRYQMVVTDPSGTIELPLDTAATLESIGLDVGDIVGMILLKVGASSLYYMLLKSTVGPIEPVCDNNGDVVRYRMSFKGGDLTGPDTLTNLGLTIV